MRLVRLPGATITFIFSGLGVIMSEAVEMDLSRWPVAARAAVNAAYVVGCIIVMLIIALG